MTDNQNTDLYLKCESCMRYKDCKDRSGVVDCEMFVRNIDIDNGVNND